MKLSYLYKITNTINNKIYIGSSKDPDRRFKAHKRKSSACLKLKYAIIEYGQENFKMEVLCLGGEEYILDIEQKLIEVYDSIHAGYNIVRR